MDWPKNWHFLLYPNQNWEKVKEKKVEHKWKVFFSLTIANVTLSKQKVIQKMWSKTFYSQKNSFIKRMLSWVQEKTPHFILMFINHARIVFYCFLKTAFFWGKICDEKTNVTKFYIQLKEVYKQRSRQRKKPTQH